ncbi:MAG: PEP-CTERM sorting domain-containing protein [Rhodospirillales bacterium]|nr:PEP-CTERM sorting domain-containing protein [Acetobacter sp.]
MNKLALSSLVFLIAAAAIPSADAQTNLVQNPGFETSHFTDWTVANNHPSYDTFVGSGNPHSGTWAAEFGNAGSLATVSQTLSTVIGQSYTFSFYFASDGTVPNEFRVSFGNSRLFDSTNIPASNYTLESFNVVATDAATTITFGGRNDLGFINLDDVSVVANVPEPSTWAMLGLGAVGAGVVALRRRRAGA